MGVESQGHRDILESNAWGCLGIRRVRWFGCIGRCDLVILWQRPIVEWKFPEDRRGVAFAALEFLLECDQAFWERLVGLRKRDGFPSEGQDLVAEIFVEFGDLEEGLVLDESTLDLVGKVFDANKFAGLIAEF